MSGFLKLLHQARPDCASAEYIELTFEEAVVVAGRSGLGAVGAAFPTATTAMAATIAQAISRAARRP